MKKSLPAVVGRNDERCQTEVEVKEKKYEETNRSKNNLRLLLKIYPNLKT